ncbi:MAG: c-type cytochrome [Nitrospiraceae bacterium]
MLVLLALSSSVFALTVFAATPQGVPERGKAVYEVQCARCHGPEGRGDGPEAPFLAPRPPNLVSAATSVKSDRELLVIIETRKSHLDVTDYKDALTQQQQQDVLAYLRTLVRFYEPLPQKPSLEQ